MKRNIQRTSLMFISLLALLASLVPAAHATYCSTATVAGSWGFTLTGTILLPTGAVPAAAVGRLTADIYGNVTGTEARNVAGGYGDETIIGSWKINPDCTGSAAADFYDESGNKVRTSVLTIVFDNNAKEVRMLQKSLTLPNGTELPVVITVEAGKQ